jgi:hypothetical protein
VSMSTDYAVEMMKQANPVPDPVDLADAMVRPSVFLATTKETTMSIDTDQPTHETPADRPSGRRRNLRALIGAVAVAVVFVVAAAIAFSMIDDTEPVASSREGAEALIGATAVVIGGGQALSVPDAIRFAEDGTFQVVQDGDTIDNGVYKTNEDLITFKSEAAKPVWENTPCQGGCMSEALHKMCREIVGVYRVTAQEPSMLTLDVVSDACPQRVSIANGLRLEVLAD